MLMPCIIASQKSWNKDLAQRLKSRLNREFIHISQYEELTNEKIATIAPEYIFFPHWSHRIPETIWGNYESIIFHMTDVPYGRGGSPLQNLIIRGHTNTKISAIRCVEEMDAGEVYLKKTLSLSGTAQEIFLQADHIIEEMIIEIIEKKLIPETQIGEPIYFKRRKPEESNLMNASSLEEAFNMIRMLDAENYPHAFLETEHLKFELRQARQADDHLEATVIIREKNTRNPV